MQYNMQSTLELLQNSNAESVCGLIADALHNNLDGWENATQREQIVAFCTQHAQSADSVIAALQQQKLTRAVQQFLAEIAAQAFDETCNNLLKM
jgi:hypothetical protein